MADKEDMKADDTPEKDDVKQAEKKPAPKKKAKKDKGDEVFVKNTIEVNPSLKEATGKTAVVGWGRMNPITSGHEKLVNKINDVARKNSGTPLVFLTHSKDPKKNPLTYEDKIRYAKKAFGNAIQKSNSKTIIQVMQELEKKFKDVILVVGADRINEFESLLNKYNGKDYNFDSIKVVSAGNRVDPDSDQAKEMTADSMSASVMRKLAAEGDFETFKKGLPKKLVASAKEVYDTVRAGMKLAEELEAEGLLDEAVLSFQQRRQRAITMRRYKNKIAMGRKRAVRRAASKEKLQQRARKKAIAIIRSKVAGEKGKSYKELSASEKMLIDKKVAKRKTVVDRIAKRMLPKVRKADRSRLSGGSARIDEAFEMFLDETTAPTKRYHEARKKDGSIKLDGRFRAFKKAKTQTEATDEVSRVKATHKREREEMRREHERELDGAKSRALRSTIRKINTNESLALDTDDELLAFIEATANDIFRSIELEEAKLDESLQKKAEKSGIEYDTLRDIYESGVDEWTERNALTPQQLGFARVNEYIVKSKKVEEAVSPAQQAAIAIAKKEKEKEVNEKYADHDRWGIKKAAAVTINRKMYNHALQALKDLLDRKKKEAGGGRNMRHSSNYYAAQIAKSYNGVDARTLHNMLGEEYVIEAGGAGDRGTPKVTKRYKKDTPGENVNEAFEAMFEDKGTVKHHLGVDTKGSSMKHMMKHATKHVDYDMDGDVDKDDFKKSVPDEMTGVPDYTKNAFDKYKREKKHTKKGVAFESVDADELFEAQFKVEVEGLPDMFIDAKSPGDVKANLRKKLKKPDDVKSIERVTPDKIKKHFRMVVRGEEDPTVVNEEVTQKQIQDLEKFADRLLDKFGVDVEFTRHFADRMNDARNKPAITVAELQKLFKKIAQNKAKSIKQNADSEAVLKDMQADLNLPVVIKFNRDKEEFEVVNKTIMRKKNFATSNKVITY